MAMLAEPRRRKRYNLCPRGKALYEDDSRFGTKMLEKMGWQKGRGLGANEDGSQEFVRVRFKNDAEGLGYENRDDQWTIHEEGFNGLLKELNGDENPAANETNGNASDSEEETRPMGFGFKAEPKTKAESKKPKTLKENISGISLEEKSKVSKARVHYKKFTRGKDLAQYSEKDLANIFGKKATDDFVVPDIAPIEPTEEEEEKPVNDNFAGVQTVSTGLSVNDYFRLKMEALKNKSKENHLKQETTEKMSDLEQQKVELMEDHDAVKMKKKKFKKQVTEAEEKVIMETEANEPKKMKSNELSGELTIGEAEQKDAPKKKKKSKHVQEISETEQEEGPKSKKSKLVQEIPEAEQEGAPKKKKKKKSKSSDKEVPKKKKKKSKSSDKEVDQVMELTDKEASAQLKKKKKSKQDKKVPDDHLTEEKLRQKKKAKRARKEAIEGEEELNRELQKLNIENEQKEKNAELKKNCKRAGELENPPQGETEETNPPKRKKKKKDKKDEQLSMKEATENATKKEKKIKKKEKKVKKIKKKEAPIEENQEQIKSNEAKQGGASNMEEKSTENSQEKHEPKKNSIFSI